MFHCNSCCCCQLENHLLKIAEEHLDKGNKRDSNVEVEVAIFQIRNGLDCARTKAITTM